MEYEWDENKALTNMENHCIDFVDVARFDWDGATIINDKRKDYGETRYLALGKIKGRLMVLVFTWRGNTVRVISLRKANTREVKSHGY